MDSSAIVLATGIPYSTVFFLNRFFYFKSTELFLFFNRNSRTLKSAIRTQICFSKIVKFRANFTDSILSPLNMAPNLLIMFFLVLRTFEPVLDLFIRFYRIPAIKSSVPHFKFWGSIYTEPLTIESLLFVPVLGAFTRVVEWLVSFMNSSGLVFLINIPN